MCAAQTNCSTSLKFPAGIRVLAVDGDITELEELATMLDACHYEVTTCSSTEDALSILRDAKNKFDIVITEVHMPNMNGFTLLKIICSEMYLPVVMMSADDEKDIIMKSIMDGASDYLVKPIRMEEIKLIWKHVIKKRENSVKSNNGDDVEILHQNELEIVERVSISKENRESSSCIKDEEEDQKEWDDSASLKRPRMVWTTELHKQFVSAVNQIGVKDAVPKKILEVMNVPSLTRENVASHLQKYRLYLRRVDEDSSEEIQELSSFHGCNVQNQVNSARLHLQNLSILQVGQNATFSSHIDLSYQNKFYKNGLISEPNFEMESQQLDNPRPLKIPRLNGNANDELFKNGANSYPVSLQPTTIYGEHFGQDDFSIEPYDEQFVPPRMPN